MTPNVHLFAIGGGGFTMVDEGLGAPQLEDYILATAAERMTITGHEVPHICYVPVARGDNPGFIAAFEAAFASKPCVTSVASVFKRRQNDLELSNHLLNQDVIWLGHGNVELAKLILEYLGLDRVIREAYVTGAVVVGISGSAGALFEETLSDAHGRREIVPFRQGLGLVRGSFGGHYDSLSDEGVSARSVYVDLVGDRELQRGYGVDDCCALHFKNAVLFEVVSARPDAIAYRVAATPMGEVVEVPLATRYLGPSRADAAAPGSTLHQPPNVSPDHGRRLKQGATGDSAKGRVVKVRLRWKFGSSDSRGGKPL